MEQLTVEQCADYLDKLFGAAVDSNAYETVCAVLRVTRYEDPLWDPLEESIRAFRDFNDVVESARSQGSEDTELRIALLMYCHCIEMTATHELLANLLRIIAGKPYMLRPFAKLVQQKKGSLDPGVPPSAKKKFQRIRELAQEAEMMELTAMIDSLLNHRVRNAFSHSDYILTDDAFRWTEGPGPYQIGRDALLLLINNAFCFTGALLDAQPRWRYWLGGLNRYYKWPRHEVLELLADEEHGLFGFSVHFSNCSKATYTRKPGEGSRPVNLRPRSDGTIDFFVGDLDGLEAIWKIDGRPVGDWDSLKALSACDKGPKGEIANKRMHADEGTLPGPQSESASSE